MPDSNITLRAVKGAALTHTEMDTNFQEFFYSASVDNVALNLFRSQSDNPSASLDLPKPKAKTYAIQLKSGSGEAANAINFTGSNSFTYDFDNNIFSVTGSSYYSGDVVVDGRMTAKVFQSQTIISSTSTGSTSFGDTADDRHLRTGSHHILGNSSVVGNKDVQGVLSITGWSDVSSSLGHLYNFSSSLDNFYVKDAHYLATRSIDSASAHTDRVARVAALSASSHSQRSTLYNYNSASIVELSGAAHTQRVHLLDGFAAADNVVSQSASSSIAELSASIHTAYLKNTTDTFTGTLTVAGTADANDVTIDDWGSVSASLATISSSASGSQLNIANNADNRLVTAQGTDYLNAEANLTFDGTHLSIGGTSITNYTSGSHSQIVGLVGGTQSGSLLEAYAGGNFVLGIRDNSTDGHDNFAVVSGDGGYYSGNQYTKLAFKVSGSGATFIGGKATVANGLEVTGSINASGDITAYFSSDERLKDNLTPIVGALDKINQIGGYEFDWNNSSEHSGHDVGVIAQEIEKVLPEVVVDRDNGYKAVRYEKIVALLIEAIKQQQLQIDELKSKI
tara:strand:+ start:16983 stop:18680 length:1698 start_codon:yes stop_codon:yes gene_type:complete